MKIYFTNVGLTAKLQIKRVLQVALAHLGQPSDLLELSLSVVSPEEIRSLNKQFRNVDSVTDVLSFPSLEIGKKDISRAFAQENADPSSGRLNLGDVIICLDRAKQQAQEYGHSLKREICFLSVHSLLHLLGYDHLEEADEKEMNALQKEIMHKAGIER